MFVIKVTQADGHVQQWPFDCDDAAQAGSIVADLMAPPALPSGVDNAVVAVSVAAAAYAVSVVACDSDYECTRYFADRADADKYMHGIAPGFHCHLEGLML